MKMTHVSQCATCQVIFEAAVLIDNDREPRKRLGAAWDKERGWQCAEADVCSQLAELHSESALRTLRIAMVPHRITAMLTRSQLEERAQKGHPKSGEAAVAFQAVSLRESRWSRFEVIMLQPGKAIVVSTWSR